LVFQLADLTVERMAASLADSLVHLSAALWAEPKAAMLVGHLVDQRVVPMVYPKVGSSAVVMVEP
jgi:hypothetical protein